VRRYVMVFHPIIWMYMGEMESNLEVYKEIIRDQGIPSGLYRDNAMEQKSHIIT
jgi:hypothetical protein